MRVLIYLRPAGVFAALYLITGTLLTMLNLHFGLNHPALRWAALFLSAYGGAMVFTRLQRKTPSRKDTLMLSTASLVVFWAILLTLQTTAKAPFYLSVFIMQSVSVFVILYLVYGHMARNYMAALIPKHAQGERMDFDPHFPKGGTFYPETYRPSTISAKDYIAEHGAFPKPDRSDINREYYPGKTQKDLGWARGSIHDGQYDRPFFMEVWAEEGHITMLTFCFSRIGIEDLTVEHSVEIFERAGIIEWADKAGVQLIRSEDKNKHPLWSFNVCVGAQDKIYVTKSPNYRGYDLGK